MMEQRLGATRRAVFMEGVHDGVPIALGYFVVAFTLGILAKTAGLSAWQGFVTSAVNIASAGEYAGFTVIAAQAPYLEIAVLTLVANARYFLMAAALAQRFAPDTPLLHRLAVSFGVTDEVFGITVARGGMVQPYYNYGALAISVPAWSAGTSAGILAGGILPAAAVSALSVALYGMFVWVILPPAKKSRPIAGMVLASFLLSLAATYAPLTSELSGGTRTILLTLLIAGVGAALFPVHEEQEENDA
ncbi:MAG: AzlC family ABC transporter permease [Selenomonas massiliensis]|uniref:AzlC family ABC transporter permease n=1 Tax=Selenomonas massiliensis TaxID=2058293 RepID=UPI000D1134ED|nr:AzlC family ABC transporter permease [Selenomonas massiliensis]